MRQPQGLGNKEVRLPVDELCPRRPRSYRQKASGKAPGGAGGRPSKGEAEAATESQASPASCEFRHRREGLVGF